MSGRSSKEVSLKVTSAGLETALGQMRKPVSLGKASTRVRAFTKNPRVKSASTGLRAEADQDQDSHRAETPLTPSSLQRPRVENGGNIP